MNSFLSCLIPLFLGFFVFANANILEDLKNFQTEEIVERLEQYEKSKEKMEELQKKYPGRSFKLNHRFAFMTQAERKLLYGMKPPPKEDMSKSTPISFEDLEDIDVPDSYDYRENNGVTPIKNQEDCGSCYIFAATAAVESQYLIHDNEIHDFSEEFLIQCDSKDGECMGGMPYRVLDTVKEIGVPEEECDPYNAKNGTCPQVDCPQLLIEGYYSYGHDEDQYAAMLYKYGPAAIVMYVHKDMDPDSGAASTYHGEILNMTSPGDCTSGAHAILLVGYTPDYWIAKNSWGEDFGDDGYFYFQRGVNFCSFTLWQPVTPYIYGFGPTSTTMTTTSTPPITTTEETTTTTSTPAAPTTTTSTPTLITTTTTAKPIINTTPKIMTSTTNPQTLPPTTTTNPPFIPSSSVVPTTTGSKKYK